MMRLAQFRISGALMSVVMALVLALFLLLLSQSVSQAAKRPSTGDATPPTLSAVDPTNNATGVAVTNNVEATFSEAMNASTINTSTFTLAKTSTSKRGTTTPVAAQVSYDPATTKATLDPSADLDPATKYTATVKGGSSGVKDLAGNPLRSDSTWSFTTAAAPPPPDTTPPDTAINSGPSATITSTSSSASFTFSASEPDSTFECKLDDETYSSCTSPKAYTEMVDGSHTFYVRAMDAAGNVDPTPASRTWTIDTTSAPPPSTKMIALTFDDGPDPANTPTILDILQRNNVKATFFVVGRQVNYHPYLVRRAYQEGHMVGNHSYTHPDLTKLSSAGVEKELRDTNTAITSAGVPQPNLFRPPYGATNAQVGSVATSLGMTQTLWEPSQSIEDWNNPPAAEICDRALRDAKPGAILGLHDAWATNTDDALECIITRLKAEGYSFGLIYPSSTYNTLNRSYVEIR